MDLAFVTACLPLLFFLLIFIKLKAMLPQAMRLDRPEGD
jgi:hypothetical protein